MIILATDSGLERTGYAFFDKNGTSYTLGEFGCVKTDKKKTLHDRLLLIYEQFQQLINQFAPRCLVIERLFLHTNQKTMVHVAQTQGVLLLLAAQYNIAVEFLTPLQIKKILTGYGRSDKKNVEKMVSLLLKIDTLPTLDDTVDAIACGLAYCTINTHLVG